jgi:acyl-coenzyme A thioesterase PaaI-like protein
MFMGQAKSGTISCTAQRRGGGKSVFMATGEVHGPDGQLLATGDGVFRYIADEVQPA